MTTPTSKTIDDLGTQSYVRFEEGKKYADEALLSESRVIALQLGTDVFEPLLIPEYHLLFDLALKGAVWANLPPPSKYNEQKKRLFTNQLAPKLGPEEFLEMLVSRINEKVEDEEEKKRKNDQTLNWEDEQELEEIKKEAKILIEMMQDITIFNKIITYINSERFRYSKG